MTDKDIVSIIEEINSSKDDYKEIVIDKQFWDNQFHNRWEIHKALGTTGHEHYCHYFDNIDLEVGMVLIESSNKENILYFIEESFDSMNNDFAFDKYNKENNIIKVFANKEKCENKIFELLSKKTNKTEEYFKRFFN